MKKNLWKLVLVSSFCAVGLGLNNGEKVSATENPAMLGNQLIAAARINNLDGVRMSIVAGADVNVRDNTGCTALMYAIQNDNLKMIILLIENGADVNAK